MQYHDLSGGVVTLDCETLLHVAEIATYRLRVELERNLSEIQNAHIYHRDDRPYSRTAYAAREIERIAGALAMSAETAEALAGLASREDVILKRGKLAPSSPETSETVAGKVARAIAQEPAYQPS